MNKLQSYIIRGLQSGGKLDHFGAYSNKDAQVNRKTYDGFIPNEVAEGFIGACSPKLGEVLVRKPDGTIIETDRKGVYIEGFGDHVSYIGAKSFTPHDTRSHIYEPLERYTSENIGFVTVAAIAGGRRIMAQLAQAEPYTSNEGGVKFQVSMTAVGGHDGQTASYFDPGWGGILICENQIPALSASSAAQSLRVRHSSNSLERLAQITDLGGELDQKASEINSEISRLVKLRMSENAFQKMLEKLFPMPEAKPGEELSKAAVTRCENTREAVSKLWENDPRAATWRGTGFGAFQAVNTFQQWEAPVRGADRMTRTLENLTGSKAIEQDLATLNVINQLAYA